MLRPEPGSDLLNRELDDRVSEQVEELGGLVD
jgi:hypothetical protein